MRANGDAKAGVLAAAALVASWPALADGADTRKSDMCRRTTPAGVRGPSSTTPAADHAAATSAMSVTARVAPAAACQQTAAHA